MTDVKKPSVITSKGYWAEIKGNNPLHMGVLARQNNWEIGVGGWYSGGKPGLITTVGYNLKPLTLTLQGGFAKQTTPNIGITLSVPWEIGQVELSPTATWSLSGGAISKPDFGLKLSYIFQ